MIRSRYFTVDCDFDVELHSGIDVADHIAKCDKTYSTTPFRIDFDTETKKFSFDVLEVPKPEYWYRYVEGQCLWPSTNYSTGNAISAIYVKEDNGDLRLLAGTERDDAIKAITGGGQ